MNPPTLYTVQFNCPPLFPGPVVFWRSAKPDFLSPETLEDQCVFIYKKEQAKLTAKRIRLLALVLWTPESSTLLATVQSHAVLAANFSPRLIIYPQTLQNAMNIHQERIQKGQPSSVMNLPLEFYF